MEDILNKMNSKSNPNRTMNSKECVVNIDTCLNLSKLKSISCQNFTSILNNPEVFFF